MKVLCAKQEGSHGASSMRMISQENDLTKLFGSIHLVKEDSFHQLRIIQLCSTLANPTLIFSPFIEYIYSQHQLFNVFSLPEYKLLKGSPFPILTM